MTLLDACVRDSRGAEKAAANEMDFLLNLPGPENFADESLLLHVELHSLTWLQWKVERDTEATVR